MNIAAVFERLVSLYNADAEDDFRREENPIASLEGD